MAGVSRETVRKAEVILKDADEPTKEALRKGEESIDAAYKKLRPPKEKSLNLVEYEMPQRPSDGKHLFDISEPLTITDPFSEEDDEDEDQTDLMAQWFRTLQHLLAQVSDLEGDGLHTIL
jgi:hypothetical protein